jgi:hypothetical protein
VAHITEKIRSPGDEILSATLIDLMIGCFAIGTSRLRVSFHFIYFFIYKFSLLD